MSKILGYWKDESGAAAAEYALILAVVCSGLVAGALFLGSTIATALDNAASYIAADTL